MKNLGLRIGLLLLFCLNTFIVFSQVQDSITKSKNEILIEKLISDGENAFSNNNVDSVKFYYNKALQYSIKYKLPRLQAETLHDLGKLYSALNLKDSSLKLFQQAVIYRKKANDLVGLNKSLGQIGQIYLEKGNNVDGLRVAREAIEVGKKAKYDKGTGIAYLNGGNLLKNIGSNEEALEYYQNASKYFDKAKFDAGIGMAYNNIAAVYHTIERFDFAIEYYQKAMIINNKTGNKKEFANTALNLGSIYSGYNRRNIIREYQDLDSMFYYYNKAKEFYTDINDISGIVRANSNLGMAYMVKGDYQKSIKHLTEAQKDAEKYNLKYDYVKIINNFALVNHKMGNFSKANEYFMKEYPFIIKGGYKEEELMWYRDIANNLDSLGNYKDALHYFEKFLDLQDTLRNTEIDKKISQLSTLYGLDLKDKDIAAANERQVLMQEKNDEMQKRLYFIIIGLFFIGGLLILVFYSFIQKRKANKLLVTQNEEIMQQKEEIEQQRNQVMSQKNIIEEQQHNILDSIHYACRIQEAILPQNEIITELFNDKLFVLFKPRDIVSGDFYWLGRKGNKRIIVAADCTGHGVPGAFMSMLGTAFINEIIGSANDSIQADDILNKLRENIIVSLRQTGKAGEQKDGMDISLTIYDEASKTIDFAGANNPLIIIRKAAVTSQIEEINRLKVQEFISEKDNTPFTVFQIQGDKMPIGIYAEQKPFENFHFQLQKGDIIYSYSDGYQDQFGGQNNKKFMIKRLKQLFVNIYDESVESQKQILDTTLVDWINEGNTEQVDDILVIGYKI